MLLMIAKREKNDPTPEHEGPAAQEAGAPHGHAHGH
jgi:hypothetical protein